ncbi:hypothetical protein SAY86_023173 [Trapa natans]|uniref:BZIP domain-containing protein n=1 Tax=Trapa natans TaxID=22666 RepID=A0AAN7RBA7_TRANT|nr:hypothetical protein SAY86_023173 [Trapa natans]
MAQLPPKIPNMNPYWHDIFSAPHHHHQKLPLQPFVAASATGPSTSSTCSNNGNSNDNPTGVDEFLDFSQARRGEHRRSVSDSMAFLDSASLLDDNVAGAGPGSYGYSGSDFDRFDNEHFVSMFTDEISLRPAGVAVSPSFPATPSDQHNITVEKLHLLDRHQMDRQMMKQNNNLVEEVHSPCDSGTRTPPGNDSTATAFAAGPSETIFDPKKVKRVLANRQSAQRSRVRKLQYIAELERSVTSLQDEVSVLSPQVAFLDHQRLLLNVDNSTLKQRIAALAQEKIFKDAHQEALKREMERLRQLCHQQKNLKNMENTDGALTPSLPPAVVSDICSDQ